MDSATLDVILRLGAAVLVGIVLGLNRDVESKPIGVRTLSLTALGAASVVVATLSVPGIAQHPDALSRVVQGHIQGLMAGIGFIGAGVILRSANGVKYMTTAATVWVAAALGIACGLGQWRVAVVGSVLALILIIVVKWITRAAGWDAE